MEFKGEKAIFIQIAESIENDILRGIILEDERAPSTNELSAAFGINPNTAAKSLSLLTADEILYKKRGVGMFVAPGAREKILEKRRLNFRNEYVAPMLREMRLIGIDIEKLINNIEEEEKHNE
jgi:GntR family transcriptional regulator